MSRQPFKKVFTDKTKLESMIVLRENGWSYTLLGILYSVDHSSIYHECKKFKVHKHAPDFSLTSILKSFDIKVPPPKKVKTYADYLRESGYKAYAEYPNRF